MLKKGIWVSIFKLPGCWMLSMMGGQPCRPGGSMLTQLHCRDSWLWYVGWHQIIQESCSSRAPRPGSDHIVQSSCWIMEGKGDVGRWYFLPTVIQSVVELERDTSSLESKCHDHYCNTFSCCPLPLNKITTNCLGIMAALLSHALLWYQGSSSTYPRLSPSHVYSE